MVNIRLMKEADLPELMIIQTQCYPQLGAESKACYLAKLQATPATCFVAEVEQKLAAYLIALPWHSAMPPAFDAPSCQLPENADCFYLHDLAVAPFARKHQLGARLVEQFFNKAQALAFDKMCLIAVEGAHTYWQRFGFVEQKNLSVSLAEKLRRYGGQAQYMQKII